MGWPRADRLFAWLSDLIDPDDLFLFLFSTPGNDASL